jgi:hypothetical protein
MSDSSISETYMAKKEKYDDALETISRQLVQQVIAESN